MTYRYRALDTGDIGPGDGRDIGQTGAGYLTWDWHMCLSVNEIGPEPIMGIMQYRVKFLGHFYNGKCANGSDSLS